MTTEINLDTGHPEKGPTLVLGGERFECIPWVGSQRLGAADAAAEGETNVQFIERIGAFIESSVADEKARKRFHELRVAKDLIDQPNLLDGYFALIAFYAARPTDEPSGSSPSPVTRASTAPSTPASPSPAVQDSMPMPATSGAS